MASSTPQARAARYDWDSNEYTVGVRSYNEVMEGYRAQTGFTYGNRAKGVLKETHASSEYETRQAARKLSLVLRHLDAIDAAADNYDLALLTTLLRSPLIKTTLPSSLEALRLSPLLPDTRHDVIGHAWGSCAWRHCGARADVEEALAEIRVGLLEPEEVRFCTGIVRRAVEEVLAEVPKNARAKTI